MWEIHQNWLVRLQLQLMSVVPRTSSNYFFFTSSGYYLAGQIEFDWFCSRLARLGANPRSFCTFDLIDIVQRTYRNINEQSVKSVPGKFLCDKPWIKPIGIKGSLATTLPWNMELNIPRIAVKARPTKNIDFIFTIDKSRLFAFNLSSSRSSFRLRDFSTSSPTVSFRLSNLLHCFSISDLSRWYFSVLYTINQVNPSARSAVEIEMNIMRILSRSITMLKWNVTIAFLSLLTWLILRYQLYLILAGDVVFDLERFRELYTPIKCANPRTRYHNKTAGNGMAR